MNQDFMPSPWARSKGLLGSCPWRVTTRAMPATSVATRIHAASSARLLQGFGLDWQHQDHLDWKSRWDPRCLFFYEALASWDWGNRREFRPYATGDPVRLGWGGPRIDPQAYHDEKRRSFANTSRNLALYMGDHVGFLGGIMSLTDVPGILRWDCLATDWFHAPAYPTWLFYNPFPQARSFHTDVGFRATGPLRCRKARSGSASRDGKCAVDPATQRRGRHRGHARRRQATAPGTAEAHRRHRR